MPAISFFSRLLDLIAPRSCAICGQRLSISEQSICATCNMGIPRTHFALTPYDNEMARLLWGQFPVERCAAFFRYIPASDMSELIHQAKYHNHPELCEEVGELMARELMATGFFEGIDLLVPVPLTKSRQRQRGYNQSEYIARGISHVTHTPVAHHAIERVAFSGSQTQKDRWQRRENVKNVFRLKQQQQVRGHHLLLVDDILTTGATVSSCAHELLKAQDVKISVLTLGFTKG